VSVFATPHKIAIAGGDGLEPAPSRLVEGFILRENHTMLVMAGELGFKRVAAQDDMVTMRAEIGPRETPPS
jgi:hypothetical protein